MSSIRNLLLIFFFRLTLADNFTEYDNQTLTFPKDFFFGFSSAAFQLEGAWNEGGKGESIWDYYTHNFPEKISNHENADIAANSYHLFEKDIEFLKILKVNTYRISISWPRVLPKGNTSVISQSAFDHYKLLIKLLKEANIRPIVALYHWDLPYVLQKEYGGWENPIMAEFYANYSRVVFEQLSDEVDWWVTFNEPSMFCRGYTGEVNYAPDLNHNGYGEYKCIHSVLLGHSKVYHMYKNEFCKDPNKCKIGIVLTLFWGEPKTSSPGDVEAAKRYMDFQFGVFAHPIFSQDGDYPDIVKRRVHYNSIEVEKLNHTRLVEFTEEEIEDIRGSADFIGINYYVIYLITSGEEGPEPSLMRDAGVLRQTDPSWEKTYLPIFFVVPWSIGKTLQYFAEKYPGYDILITENGYAGNDEQNDVDRIKYFVKYLRNVLETKEKYNIPLLGYLHWTGLDDFEWNSGYDIRFGMCYVNFSDPARPRTLKHSAFVFKDIAENQAVPPLEEIDLDSPYPDITL